MSQNPANIKASSALMQAILNSNKKSQQSEQAIQMPELALRCAQFFHSLSQYCLYFYRNYNREADIHKTKLIKKIDKTKKGKVDHKKTQKGYRHQKRQNQPEPPKKPLTAYIIYFQDKKPSFAQKFPSLSLSELTKLIAKDWKDLSDQQKKPYLDKAANDRKRYENQMIQFRKKYQYQQKQEADIELVQQKKQFSQQKQDVQAEIAQVMELQNQQILNKQEGNDEESEGSLNNDEGENGEDDDDQNEQDEAESPADLDNEESSEEKIQEQ